MIERYTLTYSSIWRDSRFKDDNERAKFLRLIDKAQWQDELLTVPRRGDSFITYRAQYFREAIDLTYEWQLNSKDAVRRLLKKWVKHGRIKTKSWNQGILITVLNFDKYQKRQFEGNKQQTTCTTAVNMAFDTIIHAYKKVPRHNLDQKPSLGVFKENDLHTKTDAIVAGIEKWAQSERWKDGYVTKLSNFLNDEQWRDEPPAPKPKTNNSYGKPKKSVADIANESLGESEE